MTAKQTPAQIDDDDFADERHVTAALQRSFPHISNEKQESNTSLFETFQKHRKEELMGILDEIDDIQRSYASKGMREWNFTFGLMNTILIFYIFGAHPGQFWILYLLQCSYWLSFKFVQMWRAKPLCEIFYYFDFCWVMNFLMLAFLILNNAPTSRDFFSPELRRELFLTAYGIAVGPIFLACMALPFVAFLFHDVNTMANLTIHLMPSMFMYILKYQPETVKEAYPDLFHLEYIKDSTAIPFFGGGGDGGFFQNSSVARNTIIAYLAWFIPYSVWMCVIGMRLPSKYKYDTVFHSLWRGAPCELVGRHVWKTRPVETSRQQTSTNQFEMRDFFLYMGGHLVACLSIGTLGLAQVCYSGGAHAHFGCLIVAILVCAKRGAERYTYYTTSMYGRRVRKHIETIIDEEDRETKVKTY